MLLDWLLRKSLRRVRWKGLLLKKPGRPTDLQLASFSSSSRWGGTDIDFRVSFL